MKLYYSKFKFTNSLFYKPVDLATLEQFDDRFEIAIFPYFNYAGTYYIHSIVQNVFGKIVYKTFLSINGHSGATVPVDASGNMAGLNIFFISLSSDNEKVKIFRSDLTGIILKK